MSNRRQSYFVHSDRTWNARTRHMVATSSRKPAIKKHNHWSGPCERGRARQCMMKCSGFCETAWIRLRNQRQHVTSNARSFFPRVCSDQGFAKSEFFCFLRGFAKSDLFSQRVVVTVTERLLTGELPARCCWRSGTPRRCRADGPAGDDLPLLCNVIRSYIIL